MTSMTVAQLNELLASPTPPLLIDVRRREAFLRDTQTLGGALRRDPESVSSWANALPPADTVVFACVHGHEVSQSTARALRDAGRNALFLEGGFADWKTAGGACDSKPAGASSRWVTRERPKIDRIACPWLISRFVDADAEFLYVPSQTVLETANAREAIPYDVPSVPFSHRGDLCTFDAMLQHYRLDEAPLRELAVIVRAADTGRMDLAPQAAGLLAISQGLSLNYPDDHAMLEHGLIIYDALYRWCSTRVDAMQ